MHELSELATSKKGINLLDILIKNEGILHPVLKRAGSMIDLGTESSAEIKRNMRKGLDDFQSADPIGMPLTCFERRSP